MNFVLIFADQMHKYALGKVSEFVHTPNLDKLCEEGILFQNAYSNSPVCGPFRGNLFTGMYTSSNKVTNNESPLPTGVTLLADAFNKGGYETSFVGKWHLGGAGNQPIPQELRGGFKHFIGYQCYNGFRNNVCFYDENNDEHRYNKHRTEVTTELTIDRLKTLNDAKKPFLQIVAYQAPHYPVQPDHQYYTLYKDKTIPYSPDYIETDPYTQTYSPPSPQPRENCPDYQAYGNNMQEYLKHYYGMVSQVDAGIGRIISTLKELGISNDTAIIFTSDHGDMQGSHGLKNKCVPYEKSCGIPLIVSAPNGRKNHVSDALLSSIDLYPTLLDYAMLPPENHLQGKSFATYTLGEQKAFDQPIFAELLMGSEPWWRMVRYQDYKLAINYHTNQPYLLFNLKEDPFEMRNLIDDNQYSGIIKEFKEMIINNFDK